MKYIRTKHNKVFEIDYQRPNGAYITKQCGYYANEDVVKVADTIEELCDERVLSHYFKETNYTDYKVLPKDQWDIMAKSVSLRLKEKITDINYLGAIWTPKGLIYVAKANDKGELELL